MKYKIALLLASQLYAADMSTPQMSAMFNEIAGQGAKKPVMETKPNEMMVIDPKDRAKDFKAAFDVLRINRDQTKITYFLEDKSQISGIMEIAILPGGTMLSFKMATTKGVIYRIVPVEQIKSIGL